MTSGDWLITSHIKCRRLICMNVYMLVISLFFRLIGQFVSAGEIMNIPVNQMVWNQNCFKCHTWRFMVCTARFARGGTCNTLCGISQDRANRSLSANNCWLIASLVKMNNFNTVVKNCNLYLVYWKLQAWCNLISTHICSCKGQLLYSIFFYGAQCIRN